MKTQRPLRRVGFTLIELLVVIAIIAILASHNYKGRSRFNMLFGDGHVEFYLFPEKLKDWTFSPGPSRDWLWW
jgi:prepilin-type N-terminal cleavage/methylation domain-containing protein/prepilin-type processing-associated H-X9-DG protein